MLEARWACLSLKPFRSVSNLLFPKDERPRGHLPEQPWATPSNPSTKKKIMFLVLFLDAQPGAPKGCTILPTSSQHGLKRVPKDHILGTMKTSILAAIYYTLATLTPPKALPKFPGNFRKSAPKRPKSQTIAQRLPKEPLGPSSKKDYIATFWTVVGLSPP